jgi:PKD repeat protein
MSPKLKSYLKLVFCIFFIICNSPLLAQLQANFTVDKSGGCSPLSVQFTNTTTGGSAATTYQWSFGNNNSSTLQNPGATYYDEKTYTVTLTAKDGSSSSSKTLQITVYKKPTVDFSISPAKGCAPLQAAFTANASPGDGSIAKYYWDFGDGETEQGSAADTRHTYTFPQKPPTSLTVTNSHGCYATTTKNGLVEVVKGVVASFNPSSASICKPGDEVTFQNNSTGSGTLTYKWDFGDGKTSSEQSPKHTYNAKGSYMVQLSVESSDGCIGTATPYIMNVANFEADFDVPTQICQNQYVEFKNTSTPGFNRIEWVVDEANGGYTNNTILYDYFSVPGEYSIKQLVDQRKSNAKCYWIHCRSSRDVRSTNNL